MQQEIVGGDPAFWNTLRSINGGGYYDIESGEIVTDTWWRDQFEDLAGGLGPLLQMSLEFIAGAGMFQAMKALLASSSFTNLPVFQSYNLPPA